MGICVRGWPCAAGGCRGVSVRRALLVGVEARVRSGRRDAAPAWGRVGGPPCLVKVVPRVRSRGCVSRAARWLISGRVPAVGWGSGDLV